MSEGDSDTRASGAVDPGPTAANQPPPGSPPQPAPAAGYRPPPASAPPASGSLPAYGYRPSSGYQPTHMGWATPTPTPPTGRYPGVGPRPGPPPVGPGFGVGGGPGQQLRMPSGLFPSGPPRPAYREPFPIRGGAVALGIVGGGLWMMLFGLLASNTAGYAWISIVAGLLAWAVALVLARIGDRGAAVGLAMSAAVALSIAVIVIAVRWAAGDWPLW
ncbi:MAG: hypothetical protein QOI74_2856 [Micromonosporaceae bacterium]|nr:hypothetical protein [Micromonosporaceae bacterium]